MPQQDEPVQTEDSRTTESNTEHTAKDKTEKDKGRHIPVDENFMEYAVRVSLTDLLDTVVTVMLRDSRVFIGRLASFDHFLNLVLEKTKERVIVGSNYADIPQGIMLVRGENVTFIGEANMDVMAAKTTASLKEVSISEILAQRDEERRTKQDKHRLEEAKLWN